MDHRDALTRWNIVRQTDRYTGPRRALDLYGRTSVLWSNLPPDRKGSDEILQRTSIIAIRIAIFPLRCGKYKFAFLDRTMRRSVVKKMKQGTPWTSWENDNEVMNLRAVQFVSLSLRWREPRQISLEVYTHAVWGGGTKSRPRMLWMASNKWANDNQPGPGSVLSFSAVPSRSDSHEQNDNIFQQASERTSARERAERRARARESTDGIWTDRANTIRRFEAHATERWSSLKEKWGGAA